MLAYEPSYENQSCIYRLQGGSPPAQCGATPPKPSPRPPSVKCSAPHQNDLGHPKRSSSSLTKMEGRPAAHAQRNERLHTGFSFSIKRNSHGIKKRLTQTHERPKPTTARPLTFHGRFPSRFSGTDFHKLNCPRIYFANSSFLFPLVFTLTLSCSSSWSEGGETF